MSVWLPGLFIGLFAFCVGAAILYLLAEWQHEAALRKEAEKRIPDDKATDLLDGPLSPDRKLDA